MTERQSQSLFIKNLALLPFYLENASLYQRETNGRAGETSGRLSIFGAGDTVKP